MEVLKTALPYIISGISVGGQYALIAIGYTMVYGILRLINFAHGDVFMVAGLMMVYFATWMPLYLAIPLMIVLTVLLGFFLLYGVVCLAGWAVSAVLRLLFGLFR